MSDTPSVPGYRILSVVGRGAMATVYRAEHERLKKTVALKVMDPVVAEDEEYRERFLREARAAAKLNHQNLVRALDAGCAAGFYFIAMELVEGIDLRRKIEEDGPLPEKEALGVAVSVCHALDEASRNGIVHRDVKPENILLSKEGVVKLTDLGLAKVSGEDVTLTKKGLTVGTVAYFAPEQALGQPDLDVRTDLYALGATLYAAVSGELPFGRGENVPETMQRILTQPAPSLAEIAPDVSEPARLVIERLMEKDRKKRPQTAREAIRLLESASEGEIPGTIQTERRVESARQSARKSMRRQAKMGSRKTGVGLGLAVAAGAAALAAFLVVSRHETPAGDPPSPPPPPSVIVPAVHSPAPPSPPRRPVSPPPSTPHEDRGLDPPSDPVTRPDPPPPPAPDPAPAAPKTEPPKAETPGTGLDPRALERVLHASKVEVVKDEAVIRYEALDAAALGDFEASGAPPEVAGGAVEWRLGPGKRAGLRHKVVLVPPVSIAFDLHVVEQAAKARYEVVFADAAGSGLAACGGARLSAWEKGAATHRLAGSEAAESLFAQGVNHRVEVELGARCLGLLDGVERFSQPAAPPASGSVAFELQGGLRVAVRRLRIQGKVDRAWLAAQGPATAAAEGTSK